jgi:hypothetical protein
MFLPPPTFRRSVVVGQIVGALGIFALIALAPPAEGTMLLVPIAGQSENRIVGLAIAGGATLVQRGPFPSSVIVYGKRASLLEPLSRAGVLTLSGGAVGCRPGKQTISA